MFREKQNKWNNITVKISLTYQEIDLYFIVIIVIFLVLAVILGIFAFFVQLFLSAARHGRGICLGLLRVRVTIPAIIEEAKKRLNSINNKTF